MKTSIYEKQSDKVEFYGPWQGLAQGTERQLEDIEILPNFLNVYKISPAGALCNDLGMSALPLLNGVHYQYGKRLDASITEDPIDGFGNIPGGIVDTLISGALEDNKVLRFVDASSGQALNMKNALGLGLKVYAERINPGISGLPGRINVDPGTNYVTFPRPIYSCKGTTVDINTAIDPIGSRNYNYPAYKPLGDSNTPSKGSMSVCINAGGAYTTGVSYTCTGYISLAGVQVLRIFGYAYNSSSHGAHYSTNMEPYVNYVSGTSLTKYFTISWDFINGCQDGNNVNIYLENTKIYTGNIVPIVDPIKIYSATSGNASVYIMEINVNRRSSIFDTPSVSALPEDALHPIYGAVNGYKPKLIAPGGVGYLYIPSSYLPASLPRTTGGDVQKSLEDPSDYANGAGYFGIGKKIYDSDYTVLDEGTDYVYDEAWDGSGPNLIDKYDDGNSGAFDTDKIVRIVNDGMNISNPAGLNLKPVIKDLSTDINPPITEFYIDPANGKFILPRPDFWCRCESLTNLTSPEIADPRYNYIGEPTHIYISPGVFGNRIDFYNSGNSNHLLYPKGRSATASNKGALSMWLKLQRATSTSTATSLSFSGTSIISFACNYANASQNYININGAFTYFNSISFDSFKHVYIVWDVSSGLSGGKSMIVFVNGAEVCSASGAFTSESFYIRAGTYNGGYAGNSWIDNIKMWDHIPTEDPSFEYNAGAGREDALHPIYGAVNGYKPKLTTPGGVGYYLAGGVGSLVRGKL